MPSSMSRESGPNAPRNPSRFPAPSRPLVLGKSRATRTQTRQLLSTITLVSRNRRVTRRGRTTVSKASTRISPISPIPAKVAITDTLTHPMQPTIDP